MRDYRDRFEHDWRAELLRLMAGFLRTAATTALEDRHFDPTAARRTASRLREAAELIDLAICELLD